MDKQDFKIKKLKEELRYLKAKYSGKPYRKKLRDKVSSAVSNVKVRGKRFLDAFGDVGTRVGSY